MSVRWPVHLALDNKATVLTLSQLLKSDLRPPKRPWSLLTNGDLWELVYALLRWRKGKASTAVQWCKGHALDADVQAGLSNPYLAWGNGMADYEAARAHEMLSYCEMLSEAFQSKQKDFVTFLVAIHAMFVRVIRAEKTLRDARVRSLSRMIPLRLPHRSIELLNARVISIPSYPDQESGAALPSLLNPGVAGSLDKHDDCILRFLSNARWVLNSLGTTWLELVIAYAFGGGTLACADFILDMPTLITSTACRHYHLKP